MDAAFVMRRKKEERNLHVLKNNTRQQTYMKKKNKSLIEFDKAEEVKNYVNELA